MIRLTNADIAEVTDFRRALHSAPELSGQESQTAAAVMEFAAPTTPDQVVTGLGGHGVALVYNGAAPGPTVMIRAELDALPIAELSSLPHASTRAGVAHLCGHDGHAAILTAVARSLGRRRSATGRVVLLFQPAEEDGSGAAAVLADPRFAAIAPDWAFALHNLPGLPLGKVVLEPGPANCASSGLKVVLSGRTSHAAQPERGLSPALALAGLIPALMALGPGGNLDAGFRLVTITHAMLGAPAFGITPGHAEIWATLRTVGDSDMAALDAAAEAAVRAAATAAGLTVSLSRHDVFAACTNDPDATAHLLQALVDEGIPRIAGEMPLRASEDFGRFGAVARSAMLYLGAGEASPALHNPDYDFPDALIDPGARLLLRVIANLLG